MAMRSRTFSAHVRRSFGVIALVALVALPARHASAEAGAGACDVYEAEYVLSANLKLADTPLGKGDGLYAIGPGTVVLLFDRRGGGAAPEVRMLKYRMRELLKVQTTALFWSTTVVTDSSTVATPGPCASAAEGMLDGRTLRWSTPVRGYRTDGTLTCDGSLCGKFGAPPPGRSELHVAPHPVTFSSFEFGADGKTFSMGSTFVSKTESPKHTAHMAISGREVRRQCVSAPTCS
jgi:hypothetical protein